MRFNDSFATVLAMARNPHAHPGLVWRQLVDLIAQHDRPGGDLAEERVSEALAMLNALRSRVPETERLASVIELGTRLRSERLVLFFAEDRSAVCAAALSRAQLDDAQWIGLLTHLSPTGRGVLRHRRDLGAEAVRGLQAFGPSDWVLHDESPREEAKNALSPVPAVVPPPVPVETKKSERGQISELVDRIRQYTSTRERSGTAGREGAPLPPAPIQRFAFETGPDGIVQWVDGAPRGQTIGVSIASARIGAVQGADGHAIGAFHRRTSFRNARLTIAAGLLAGEWRISGVPYFSDETGRFLGFRGHARRPYPTEVATPDRGETDKAHVDSMRQLVHELRTPLNAILGFSEIIEHQLFGPAAQDYRVLSRNIASDAQRLLLIFDDLDASARIDRGDLDDGEDHTALGALLDQAASHVADQSEPRIPLFRIEGDPEALALAVPERAIGRILRHFMIVASALIDSTGDMAIHVERSAEGTILSVRCSQAKSVGPSSDEDAGPGEAVAPLGVDFTLRLLDKLATAAGGRFAMAEGALRLTLRETADSPEVGAHNR